MSYDIYGNNLRSGYCEVHPQVHESYPCSLCYAEGDKRNYDKRQENEYYRQMEIDHQRDMEIEEQKHSFARSQAEKFTEWKANEGYIWYKDKETIRWFVQYVGRSYTTSDLYSQFLLWQEKQQEGKGE